jgi:hypothetical protein
MRIAVAGQLPHSCLLLSRLLQIAVWSDKHLVPRATVI